MVITQVYSNAPAIQLTLGYNVMETFYNEMSKASGVI